jgi:hypothetical protein
VNQNIRPAAWNDAAERRLGGIGRATALAS